MSTRGVALSCLLAVAAVFISGCFSSHPEDISAFVLPSQVDASAENYVLQPPDVVQVYCSEVPSMHLQSQRIRPDGKISFEGIGEMLAAGKTCEQLAEDLRSKMEAWYSLSTEKPVDIRISAFKSKSYYVLGQCYFRGAKDYTGRETVLDALADARLTTLAWKERIQVVRPSANPDVPPKIFEVNYDKMVAHGDTSKNVLLEEGDIIYVPPTVLASIGLMVEELVSPVGRAFSTVNVVQGPPGRRD